MPTCKVLPLNESRTFLYFVLVQIPPISEQSCNPSVHSSWTGNASHLERFQTRYNWLVKMSQSQSDLWTWLSSAITNISFITFACVVVQFVFTCCIGMASISFRTMINLYWTCFFTKRTIAVRPVFIHWRALIAIWFFIGYRWCNVISPVFYFINSIGRFKPARSLLKGPNWFKIFEFLVQIRFRSDRFWSEDPWNLPDSLPNNSAR